MPASCMVIWVRRGTTGNSNVEQETTSWLSSFGSSGWDILWIVLEWNKIKFWTSTKDLQTIIHRLCRNRSSNEKKQTVVSGHISSQQLHKGWLRKLYKTEHLNPPRTVGDGGFLKFPGKMSLHTFCHVRHIS